MDPEAGVAPFPRLGSLSLSSATSDIGPDCPSVLGAGASGLGSTGMQQGEGAGSILTAGYVS